MYRSLAVLCIILSFCGTANFQQFKSVVLECSESEMKSLQRHWTWLMRQTTIDEKVALYELIMAELARHHDPATSEAILQLYRPSSDVLLKLSAYRLFSFYDMYFRSYTSPQVYVSHLEHLYVTQPTTMKAYFEHMRSVMNAVIIVIGDAVQLRDEKVTLQQCLFDMAETSNRLYQRFKLHSSCDINSSSRGTINGRVNFTQSVLGGATTVDVELSGFQDTNRTHVLCVQHKETSSTKRLNHSICQNAVLIGRSLVLPDGRIFRSFHVDHISLFGEDDIIGNTFAVGTEEDKFEKDGIANKSAAGDHCLSPPASCVVYQTFV